MKLLAGIAIAVLLIISIGLMLEYDRADSKLVFADSVNVRLQREIVSRELEAQRAWRKAQCYKEEVARLKLLHERPDTNGAYLTWTDNCNGSRFKVPR